MKKQVSLDAIISALTHGYERLFWSDIHTGEIRFINDEEIPKIFAFLSDEYLSHDEKMRLFANKLVADEDRKNFIKKMSTENLIEVFNHCDSYTVRYRTENEFNEINYYENVLFRAPSEEDHLCLVFAIHNINDVVKEEGEQAAHEEHHKTYGIVTALANDYESIFLIDSKTGKFTPYRLIENIRIVVPEWDKVKTFDQLISIVAKILPTPDDKEIFLNDIKHAAVIDGLAHGDSYIVKHRTINGTTVKNWELKFAYGDEDRTVIVCGIRNVDSRVAEQEEKKHFLQDHARQKAFVNLFADSYVAAYYVNLFDGHYRIYKASIYKKDDSIEAPSKFDQAMASFANLCIAEEDVEEFVVSTCIDTIKNMINGEDKDYVYTFKAKIDNTEHYFKMRALMGHDSGHAAVGFVDVTEEHEKAEKEAAVIRQNAIISSLTSDFELVNYVEIHDDKKEDTVIESRLSSVFSLFPELEFERNFSKRIEYIAEKIVLPADREDFKKNTMREAVMPSMLKGNAYFVTFRAGMEDNAAYYQLKFTPDLDAAGFLKGVVVGIHSIDEQMKKEFLSRREAQESLETINKQKEELEVQHALLEVANNSKTAFLFNMSHDIRTPMNAITGFADLAEKHIDEKDKVLDYIGKIQIASDHLLKLINEILDMSRVESGKITSEMTPVNVLDATNEIVLMCKEAAAAKAIYLSFDSGDVPNFPVFADVLHVNRILLNVMSNAIKYTRPGGKVALTTTLLKDPAPGYVGVSFVIQDNGIGMSPEFLEHVFDSFSREQTSTISGVEGTGLGMAIVKKLVDFLDGTIAIESVVNVGTKVTINLQFKHQEAIAKPVARSAPKIRSMQGMIALLVEDNNLNREIAKEILEEVGVTVVTAENGKVAVEIVEDLKPSTFDFVLMDIQMPVMDGLESARQIRTIKGADRLPIIALSANAFAEDKKKSLDAGMNDHIAKPIDVDVLFETLSKFVQ